jgi:hypothetical protein
VAVTVAVAAGIGVYVYSRGGGLSSYGCAYVVSSQDESASRRALELCQRKHDDQVQRAPIASRGPIGYEGTAMLMRDVIARSLCPTIGYPSCRGGQQTRPATSADVEAATGALTRAGLADSVVRVAHPQDPAPDGALVYALRMGDGCVVGYLEVGRGTGDYLIGGLLPNGQCLAS